MKKSLAALILLVALSAPALAGIMEAGGTPDLPPPEPPVTQTIAATVVPAIVLAIL